MRQGKGQGWYGNSAGHAKAGKRGGEARARNLKLKKQQREEQEKNK